jgi:Flp pilus assembly protein TadG
MVEAAIVYPAALMLILGVLSGGMGIFRYQEMASLARAASRYASMHGSQYALNTGKPAATRQDIYNNAIVPNAVGLDLSKLSYTVTWNPNNQPPDSTVTVTVSYQWSPEVYLLGTFTLTSTSTQQMVY